MKNIQPALLSLCLLGCSDEIRTSTVVNILSQRAIDDGPWRLVQAGEEEREVALSVDDVEFRAVDPDGATVARSRVLFGFNLLYEYVSTQGEESTPITTMANVPCYVVDRATPPFAFRAVEWFSVKGSFQRMDGTALLIGASAICDR